MSRVLVIDPRIAGASGDMFVSALIDIGGSIDRVREVAELIEKHLDFVEEFSIDVTVVKKAGSIRASKVVLKVHEHRHEHGHHNDVHEYTIDDLLRDAREISRELGLRDSTCRMVADTIDILVEAESRVHGVSRDKVHFHELASSDTLFDVIATYALLEELGFLETKRLCLPVATGSGVIRMAHGVIPSPAPAVLEIACRHGIPLIHRSIDSELLTPTGAALIASITTEFVETMPSMVVKKIGYGAGDKEFEHIPNVLRVIEGEVAYDTRDLEVVGLIETNVDDVTGETLGYLIDKLLSEGALDVQVIPTTGKKNRPSHIIQVITRPGDKYRIAKLLMIETGTLGVRIHDVVRMTAYRETKSIEVSVRGRRYSVRVKYSKLSDGTIVNVKPEYSDLEAISRETGIPLRKLHSIVYRCIGLQKLYE